MKKRRFKIHTNTQGVVEIVGTSFHVQDHNGGLLVMDRDGMTSPATSIAAFAAGEWLKIQEMET